MYAAEAGGYPVHADEGGGYPAHADEGGGYPVHADEGGGYPVYADEGDALEAPHPPRWAVGTAKAGASGAAGGDASNRPIWHRTAGAGTYGGALQASSSNVINRPGPPTGPLVRTSARLEVYATRRSQPQGEEDGGGQAGGGWAKAHPIPGRDPIAMIRESLCTRRRMWIDSPESEQPPEGEGGGAAAGGGDALAAAPISSSQGAGTQERASASASDFVKRQIETDPSTRACEPII